VFQVEEDKKPRIDLQNLAKRRKKRRSSVKVSSDVCFICGEGGELRFCDNKTCPKGYHLQCLKLERFPHGENCVHSCYFYDYKV
jgi:histone-lysine N-methyltransferase NSD2